MVKYLGLDYLKLAISQKQHFLNQALIPVPEHLEVVDNYIHRGNIEDERYRHPWQRASCASRFLIEEKSKSFLFESAIPVIQFGLKAEKYDGDQEIDELGYFDLDDFIPSSNPGSPVSKHSPVKQQGNNFLEEHQKFNLQDAWIYHIEEPLTTDLFTTLKKSLPSLKSLKERLHQNQISDLFTLNSTNDFDHGDNLRLKNFEPKQHTEIKDCFLENFAKNSMVDNALLLEDTLSPFVVAVEGKMYKGVLITEDLNEISKNTLDTEDWKLPSCSLDLNQHGEVLLVENRNNEESFLSINKIGDEEDLISKARLDSPVVTTNYKLETRNLQIKSFLQPLERFQVPEDGWKKLLSSTEIEIIELKTWQKEKYFCDILSLRIAEPDVEWSMESHLSLLSALQNLELVRDHIGDIELSLNWDPIGHMITNKNMLNCAEKMDACVQEKKTESFTMKIEKYCSAELIDCHDDLLKMVSSNRSLLKEDFTCDNIPVETDPKVTSLDICDMQVAPEESIWTDDFGFDQIDDFFTLRTGVRAERKPKQAISSQFFEAITETTKKECSGKTKEQKTTKSMLNSDVMLIQLGDTFEDILNTIDEKAKYLLTSLRATGDVQPIKELCSLTTDFTRFLVKQTEKQMIDSTENEMLASYKTAVCLHALWCARDVLLNCCLESAIAHLQAAEEKYQSSLTAGIEDIRQNLFQVSCLFQQKKIHHPKIIATCREIEKCLEFKDTFGTKVLIIIKRNFPSFLNVFKEVVNHSGFVKLKIQEDSQIESVISSLEECNCMMVLSSLIQEDFPWSMFTLVIDYEYEEESSFGRLCELQNLRYIALTTHIKNTGCVKKNELTMPTSTNTSNLYCQRTIVGSTMLTAHGDILPLLETRFNILVLERNYNVFDQSLCFADIDVDHKACIVLQSMNDMSDENQLEIFLKKIISLSLKYTICWILLCNLSKPGKSYLYAGNYISNMGKLQASLGNYVSKINSFEVKVLSCYTAEETCSSIRKICDVEVESSDIWNKEEWMDGKWLTENMTKEERLLLALPCMNSISAQIILKKLTLKELLAISEENLITRVPMISKKVLQMLLSILQSNQGLNSRFQNKEMKRKHCKEYDRLAIHKEDKLAVNYKDEQKLSCDSFHTVLHNNRFFTQNELFLKQPVFRRNHEDNMSAERSECFETFDKSYNQDSFMYRNQRPGAVSPETGIFPEKRCRLKFGSRYHCDFQEPFLKDSEFNYYPGEEKDTQDTDDVLSLNGSQSSVELNEYEKAVIEGRVNRISKLEMMECDFESNSSLMGKTTKHTFVKPDTENYNIKQTRSNPKPDCRALISANLHSNYDTKEYSASESAENVYRILPFGDQNSYQLSSSQNDRSCDQSAEGYNKTNLSCEKPRITVQGRTALDLYAESQENMLRFDGKSETLQNSVTDNMHGAVIEKRNSECCRNFARDLSETTKNILKQAYQSPRFGVKPRPFTQRISVGLAQPLRRESTSNQPCNERNTPLEARHNIESSENNTSHLTKNEIFNQLKERSHNTYSRHDNRISVNQTPEEIYRHNQTQRSEINWCKQPFSEIAPLNHSNLERRTEKLNRPGLQQTAEMNMCSQNNRAIGNIQQSNNGIVNKVYKESDDTVAEGLYHHSISVCTNKTQDTRSNQYCIGYVDKPHRPPVQDTVENRSHLMSVSHRQWQGYDSPPMDLDYLDNLVESRLFTDENRYSDIYLNHSQDVTSKMFLTSNQSVPNKRRKLAYVRQPGSKGGQTKLVFK